MKEVDSKCYYQAVKYISRYPKTEKELTIYLLEKWYLQDEIDQAMEYLKYKTYVNDENFVDMYFHSEVISKWRPLYVATNKLHQKWIDKSLITAFIEEHEAEIQEWIYNKIHKIIAQYKSRWVEWFDIIQKIMAKWYKLDDIKAVINKNRRD